jgi:hypothetical protein
MKRRGFVKSDKGISRRIAIERSMVNDATLALAAALIRQFPLDTDDHLCRRLIVAGISAVCSARLIEFLPLAYCRVLLRGTGIRFSADFQRVLADGTLSPSRPLASEPLWNAAMEFAARQVQAGMSQQDLLAIARRSAEFDAVNQLLNRGSAPEDLILQPVIFSSSLAGDVDD